MSFELVKICRRCCKSKTLDQFHKEPKGFLGRKANCIPCRSTLRSAASSDSRIPNIFSNTPKRVASTRELGAEVPSSGSPNPCKEVLLGAHAFADLRNFTGKLKGFEDTHSSYSTPGFPSPPAEKTPLINIEDLPDPKHLPMVYLKQCVDLWYSLTDGEERTSIA